MEVGEVCDEDIVCDMLPDGSNVRQFIQQYQNGELKFYVKSAEPPEENNDPVKIVTGNTFKSIVLDEEKDVFVEFYAPWCGHCKTLEPIWEELAQTLLEDEKILFAKMDATANHPPKYFRYSGFPTIFWAGRGAKDEPEQYKGSRNIEGFLQFIRERVDYKLKLDETKESEENNSYEHTEL
ncbi:Oidioi.mRNA.OKI2018_I69.XSR.g14970.t1.cds [Oikopleura dioica]|uniref:Protein disulfide-isomerase A3 n=1 Tax=Oikopleura dioica TaxID=34765 RepID=A0ABN7SFE5_OIKDI|nr:Oidioi.mRNA.OKI2018_I69.XSR.g14970.t1.cds [Oikopleura dioica]